MVLARICFIFSGLVLLVSSLFLIGDLIFKNGSNRNSNHLAKDSDSTFQKSLARTPMKSRGAQLNCPEDQLKRSQKIPTNVNKVRPADIKIIGALGDSITGGSRSKNFEEENERIFFMGNSFSTGADEELKSHVTLTNILRKFSPSLQGGSHGQGLGDGGFNVARSGNTSKDLPGQAAEVVDRMRKSNVDIEQDWKLITLFIGTNDLGRLNCYPAHLNNPSISAKDYKANIEKALEILKTGLPRTIIAIMSMWPPMLAIEADTIILQGNRKTCHDDSSVIAQRDTLTNEYRAAVYEIQNERKFNDEKFTVIVQGFVDDYKDAFMNGTGEYDLSFYASDMFHLSKYGNAVIAKALWNSLLQPIGQKDKRVQLGDDETELACPTKEYPYIFTMDNSILD